MRISTQVLRKRERSFRSCWKGRNYESYFFGRQPLSSLIHILFFFCFLFASFFFFVCATVLFSKKALKALKYYSDFITSTFFHFREVIKFITPCNMKALNFIKDFSSISFFFSFPFHTILLFELMEDSLSFSFWMMVIMSHSYRTRKKKKKRVSHFLSFMKNEKNSERNSVYCPKL